MPAFAVVSDPPKCHSLDMSTRTPRVLILAVSLVVAGCTSPDPDIDEPHPCDVAVYTGEAMVFVVDSLHFPSKASEATALGLDLDGDELGRVDNAFGQIYVAVAGATGDLDLDASTRELIEAGEILHLLELRTTTVEGYECAEVRVRHAVDLDGDPTDNFSGQEPFSVDLERGEGRITGVVQDGLIDVKLGNAPVAVTFFGDSEPVVVDLGAAALRGELTERGFEGVLAGGIPNVDTELIPLLHRGVVNAVEGDCQDGLCQPGSFGEAMLDIFDYAPADGVVTLDEFRGAQVTRALFLPDVDLYDEDGILCLQCDGDKDSLSVGIGFTAVPALIP